MAVSNDHYVSQFYLRNFSPGSLIANDDEVDDRNIRLINLASRRFIPSASIKGQCKKAGFHNFSPGLETALGVLEGNAASAIRNVIQENRVPARDTFDHEALVVYAVFQRSRTEKVGEQADKASDRMFKLAYQSDPRLDGIDLSKYEFKSEYPIELPLGIASDMVPFGMQLGLHVFINETDEEFISSDNPAVSHNQFCEGIEYRGVIGWNCAGIQILLPLSPRHILLLYDSQVYALGGRRGRGTTRIVDVDDVKNLNAFQIVSARENVYFSGESMAKKLLLQVEQLNTVRQCKRIITVETESVSNEEGERSLLHQFERMAPLKFRVYGFRVKRNMKRIPLYQRGSMYRNPPPLSSDPGPNVLPGTVRYPISRIISD